MPGAVCLTRLLHNISCWQTYGLDDLDDAPVDDLDVDHLFVRCVEIIRRAYRLSEIWSDWLRIRTRVALIGLFGLGEDSG